MNNETDHLHRDDDSELLLQYADGRGVAGLEQMDARLVGSLAQRLPARQQRGGHRGVAARKASAAKGKTGDDHVAAAFGNHAARAGRGGCLHRQQGDARRPARGRAALGARFGGQVRYAFKLELPAYRESAQGGAHRGVEHKDAPAYSTAVHAV